MRRKTAFVYAFVLWAALASYGYMRFEGMLFHQARIQDGLKSVPVDEICNAVFAAPFPITNFNESNRQSIIDRVQLMRMYSHCYLREKVQPTREINLKRVEKTLFPMLEFSPSEAVKSANGRGIIMSMGDTGVQDLKGLIRVLDLMGNKLPIEIYHKNDINPAYLATVDFGNQNVRFVDAHLQIPKTYEHKYTRFVNKWLPFLLTSFEEIIYMDTDVVPFVNPETFFASEQYRTSQSHFFKDRSIDQKITQRNMNFVKKLYPSLDESAAFRMDTPLPSQISNKMHLVESGVVVLNRTRYMPGLVLAASLHFWPEVSEIFWGDKELFVIGQLASGENGFQLNKHAAGALGVVNSMGNPLTREVKETSVCSIQIAHVDSDLNLLWVNGGLRKCKLGSWDKDWTNQMSLRNKYGSKQEMKDDFLSPMNATGVIIPPEVPQSMFGRKNAGFRKNAELGCSGYTWCAYDTFAHPGITIRFDEAQQQLFDRISRLWWRKLNV